MNTVGSVCMWLDLRGMTSWKKKGGLLILGKGKDAFVPAPPGEKRGIHSSEEGRGGVGRSVFPSP